MIQVFVGYDPRQPIAAQVLSHSIAKHSTHPVSISRLQLSQLPIKRRGLTDFTYSRFLVPWLCDFKDMAVFVDSDFVVLGDMVELIASAGAEQLLAKSDTSVWVSKNKLAYEWPSLMVFDNTNCRDLVPQYVDNPANALFDFKWAKRVGDLPAEWNFLVGYDKPGTLPKAIHYTQGIPCWPETKDCDFAEEWRKLARESQSSVSFNELMGRSVHAEAVRKRLAGGAA